MKPKLHAIVAAIGIVTGLPAVVAAASDADDAPRPFVAGGIYDKPFLHQADRATIGGYLDAQYRHERVEGVKGAATFALERINLFAYAMLSDRVRFASEIEIEEGGEEIKVELAAVDFEIHEALTFRGGVLLSPLGRFNVAHDSPANELVDRPLVSTRIIPTTLSEPGGGFFGAFHFSAARRAAYELYLVNGLGDGVIEAEGGTSIPGGKGNLEDNNGTPSLVGRFAVSPVAEAELGFSFHTGPYNTFEIEGVAVDDPRDLTILAIDGDVSWRFLRLTGEYARASIDVPAEAGIFAETQQGLYVELAGRFLESWLPNLPRSRFGAAGRWDFADLDADRSGDDLRRLTLGASFRPVPDTVFKLDWQRTWSRDPFENEENEAALLFGVASYF